MEQNLRVDNAKEDIIELIMNRDHISYNEACACVMDCIQEVQYAIQNFASYDEIADIVADYLGLEPDYLDQLISF